MPEQPKIGLVTVTYNSAAVLPGFMKSLQGQNHHHWQLIAVDNQSQDSSVELLQSYQEPRVTIIANDKNWGVAKGNNQGIQEALRQHCKYIVLINNDTEFPPQLLTGLWQGLEQLGCDMVVPKMYYYEPRNHLWFAGGGFRKGLYWLIEHRGKDNLDTGQFDEVRRITYAPTCCVLMSATVVEKVGLMDERYFVYYDDVDFFLRALRAGCVTYYLPNLSLYHKVSALTGGDESTFGLYMQSRNTIYFLKKHFPIPALLWGLLGQQLYLWARLFAAYDKLSSFRTKQRGFRDGLKM